MWSMAQPQSGLATSSRCCSGCIRFQSPAAVRHSRRKEQFQLQLRTQQQQFSWAVSFGSVVSSTGYATLFLRSLGMGLWSHRLSFALSLLTLCLSRCPLVSLNWRVPSTSTTWHGCRVVSLVIPCARSQTHRGYPCILTTRSRTSSQVLLVPHWGYPAPSRGSRPFLACSLLGFLVVKVLLRASHLVFIWSLVLVMCLHTARLQAVQEPMVARTLMKRGVICWSFSAQEYPWIKIFQ